MRALSGDTASSSRAPYFLTARPSRASRRAPSARRDARAHRTPRPRRALASDEALDRAVLAPTIAVYTKPECCLCDGLKEKIERALELAELGARSARTGGTRDALRGFALDARDVSACEAWGELYAGSVPRVFLRDPSSKSPESWVEFPRPSPKTSAERVCDDLDALVRAGRRRDVASAPTSAGASWVVSVTAGWDPTDADSSKF